MSQSVPFFSEPRVVAADTIMMRRNVSFQGLACGLLLAATLSCGGDGVSVTVSGLRFVSQPSSAIAGQSFTVTVELIASGGKRVTSATDMVALSVGGGATLGGTTSVPAIGGLATFSGISISRAGSNFQLSASSGAFTNTGTAFSVAAGAPNAAQSTLTLNPAALTTTGSSTVTFTFKDEFGNPLAGMSVVLSSALGGVTFTPSSGTTLADGTFSTSVTATSAGSASVSATVGGLVVTIATPIVILSAATALRFVTQPASVTAGQTFSVSVEFITAAGQRATIANAQITLTASGGVAFTGTKTVAAIAGLATFDGLSITTATMGIQLTASGGGATVNGAAFNINAGPLALAQSTLSFSPPLNIGTTSTGTFTLKDAFGNALASAAVSLTSSLAGTTFAPSSGTTNASGGFASQFTPGTAPPVSGTITATVGTDQAAFPVTIAVAPGVCNIVGPMTLGSTVNGTVVFDNGCVNNGHSAAVYQLAVPDIGTSTVVAVTGTGLAAGFFPELSVTTDPPVGNRIGFGNSAQTAVNGPQEWLLPSGAFQVWISSSNGNGGDFSLGAVSEGVGTRGCKALVLVNVSATYTGQTLASTDCVDPSGPYYIDLFAVADSRPCTITMRAAFDAWLEIHDSAGNLVAFDNDGGGGTDAQVSLSPCTAGSGIATIVASSNLTSISGPYTLTVTFIGAGLKGLRSGPDVMREFPMGARLLPIRSRQRR